MKTIGEAVLIEKRINEKDVYFIRVREYNRDGIFTDAELYCRLTNNAKEQLGILRNTIEIEGKYPSEIQINIQDSFYTVDKYFKGEEQYTKPTLVIKEIEI